MRDTFEGRSQAPPSTIYDINPRHTSLTLWHRSSFHQNEFVQKKGTHRAWQRTTFKGNLNATPGPSNRKNTDTCLPCKCVHCIPFALQWEIEVSDSSGATVNGANGSQALLCSYPACLYLWILYSSKTLYSTLKVSTYNSLLHVNLPGD